MSDAVLEQHAMRRELGVWDCGRPGPTLLVLAGMHGNEPAGVLAVRQLLRRLDELELPIAGRVVALAGNLAALAERQRFVDRDLNRGWGAAAVDRLRGMAENERVTEDAQQLDLLGRFEELVRTATGPLVVADLHTSSAHGPPFLCLADTIDNRRLGLATGVPIILGIEETIEGAALEWFADRGIVGVAVEGGQHDDEATVANHEAVLWRVLRYLGMLPAELPEADLESWTARLAEAVGNAPPIVEIVQRRVIAPEDDFEMEPGFRNFDRVDRGALLARDRQGEIRASRRGLVMLPLYQRLGDDGFFLARKVRRFWLWLAAAARALRLGALLPLLPGVRRDPEDRLTIVVDPRVARWFVTEIFHLLGYRKRRARGDRVTFSRRISRPENARLGRNSTLGPGRTNWGRSRRGTDRAATAASGRPRPR